MRTDAEIEAAAKAWCISCGVNPNTRYEDTNPPEFPEDEFEFLTMIDGSKRRVRMFYAWRKQVIHMRAAIAAADALAQDADIAKHYDPEDRAARSSDGDMALHLMTLDNFLGGQGGVSGAADAREALEQITDYLAEAGENTEIARLRRDCAELYQVIGVLAAQGTQQRLGSGKWTTPPAR